MVRLRGVSSDGIQWRIQSGFHGFHGTLLLKGSLRKYYAQTYTTYTTPTLELRTPASTVAITHMCQLLYQEFNARMAYVSRVGRIMLAYNFGNNRFQKALHEYYAGIIGTF